MSGFSPPKYSYGGGFGRFVVAQVVNRKDDPEQSGRLRVRVVGYQDDKGGIPDDMLHWGRPAAGITDPRDGGVSGPLTGATENTFVMGFYSDGDQQLILTHTLGKAGKDQNGEGQLNQSGRNADLNPHSRDKEKGGGDFRYASERQDFDRKSITDYAKDESGNPHGRKTVKDGDEDENKSRTIGTELYV